MLSERNEGIKAAYNELTSLNNDDVRRQIYNSRKKTIMDYNVQNRAAREEGKKEEKEKIAIKLLKAGVDIEIIKSTTGLEDEEIQKLKEEK